MDVTRFNVMFESLFREKLGGGHFTESSSTSSTRLVFDCVARTLLFVCFYHVTYSFKVNLHSVIWLVWQNG